MAVNVNVRPSDRSGEPVSAVVELELERLRPWPDNPRSIRPERLEQLKQALAADPQMLRARPLLALPDGTVIAGNQRLRAARELGWRTIPVITVDLEPERVRLWALRDNNAYGEWDEPALAELLAELADEGLDVALAGFEARELDRLLTSLEAATDPDEAPALVEGPSDSRPGEIYQLGPHRLACGDARDGELLARLLAGERPAVLWTDPPYGVAYVGKTKRALTIENDDDGAGALLEAALRTADPYLAASAPFYIASPAGAAGTAFRLALESLGWRLHQSLAWVKNAPVLGHSDYHYLHEDVLYGWKPGPGRPGRGRHRGSRWYGDNSQVSALFVDRPARSDEHPTMKPVALIAAHLRNSSRRGEAVLDLFAGSGSTLIACEQLGRRCLAVELDPRYCDVIRRRYRDYCDGR
jgi:site-specific DNA-methyltransferase (adenine-specific)